MGEPRHLITTSDVLNRLSPAEVKRHVRERLEIFASGGGFVFNTVHTLCPQASPAGCGEIGRLARDWRLLGSGWHRDGGHGRSLHRVPVTISMG
jgi:hypothetical protein